MNSRSSHLQNSSGGHLPVRSVRLDLRCYQREQLTHCHEFHQLVLPLCGTMALEIDGNGGRVDNRCAAVIAANSRHAFIAENPNRFVVADVPQQWAMRLESLSPFSALTPALSQYILFIAKGLEDESLTPSIQHQVLSLLLEMMATPESVNRDRRVMLAKQYLDAHLGDSVAMADVAAACHLSVRQLSTLFKQHLGVSVGEYLRNARMTRAEDLLKHSDLQIGIVAQRVGYHNLAAFSDRFAKHFGKPPSHFRRCSKNQRLFGKTY